MKIIADDLYTGEELHFNSIKELKDAFPHMAPEVDDTEDPEEVIEHLNSRLQKYSFHLIEQDHPLDRIIPLKHKNVSHEQLKEALDDEDPMVREFAIRHPALSEEALAYALRHPDDMVRELAANHPTTKRHLIDLSPEEAQVIVDTIKSPPGPTQALIDAFKAYKTATEQETDKKAIQAWLSQQNAPEASVVDHGTIVRMSGFNPKLEAYIEAAKFLSGKEEPHVPMAEMLSIFEDDLEGGILGSFGLDIGDKARESIRSVVKLKNPDVELELTKSLQVLSHATPVIDNPKAKAVADAINNAILQGQFQAIKLRGKHSKGSFLVKTILGNWLIKPGSGKNSPGLGIDESTTSQSDREAAFYAIAELLGLGHRLPETHLMVIDNQRVPVIRMLPSAWETLEEARQQDVGLARKSLEKYRHSGELHKWAIADFILGNVDRHGRNLMYSKQDNNKVMLIDHGSSLAGNGFSPWNDKNSFIPFYLRAWSDKPFSKLSTNLKLQVMPRVNRQVEKSIREWLNEINPSAISNKLQEFSVDAQPVLNRLQKIKLAITDEPVDAVINRFWVSGE